MDLLWPVIGTIIVGLLANAAGLLAVRRQGRKTEAETDSAVVSAAKSLLSEYRQDNEELRKEMATLSEELKSARQDHAAIRSELLQLRKETVRLKAGAITLAHQVRMLGMTPLFNPEYKDKPDEEEG